ncbi:MAG: DUF2807 domain-containing protein [Flavobacteriales bacterium]|nr:DUF2807 domain-containing protein [Flavobacteriales bacterium]
MELRRLLPLLLIALAGCQREQWDDCITSTGPVSVDERAVGAFTAIDLSDRIDLVLEDRAPGTIAVEAGRNLLDQVTTEVKDGTLRIRSAMTCNWVRSFKPRITVHVPVEDICRLTVRGTGDIACTDSIRCDYFLLEQWGAEGRAQLLLRTARSDIAMHTGAGSITLHGSTGLLEVFSGIMAPIDARGVVASTVNVNNGGVADIRCFTNGTLNVRIDDVGDVYYGGSPDIISSTINGSGRLIPY